MSVDPLQENKGNILIVMNQKLDKIIAMLEEQNRISEERRNNNNYPRVDLTMIKDMVGGMGDIVQGVHGGDMGGTEMALEKMKTMLVEQIEREKEKQLKSKLESEESK
jgi:hypothetical protein